MSPRLSQVIFFKIYILVNVRSTRRHFSRMPTPGFLTLLLEITLNWEFKDQSLLCSLNILKRHVRFGECVIYIMRGCSKNKQILLLNLITDVNLAFSIGILLKMTIISRMAGSISRWCFTVLRKDRASLFTAMGLL